MSTPFRRLDHAVVFSPDAQALFDVFAVDLDLPVVWPVFDFGGWVSGGISLGNANLEIAQVGDGPAAALAGLVFEPEGALEDALAGLSHGAPQEYCGPMPEADGIRRAEPGSRYWTSCQVERLGIGFFVALCAYERALLRGPDEWARVLDARGGGALGLTGLARIVAGVVDPDGARQRLEPLLRFGLEIVESDRDGLQALEVTVRSPGQARERLAAVDLQGLEVRIAS